MDIIRKEFQVTVKAIDEFTYEATINTAIKDRAGDIVIPQGAQIENFMRNPVIPWAHQYDQPPVARALAITLTDSALVSRFQFPQAGVYEFADTIRRLWRDGFLNAMSIGFIPLRWVDNNGKPGSRDDRESWFWGGTVTEWELLEHSIVPVPANQQALRRIVDPDAWPPKLEDLRLPPDYLKALEDKYGLKEGRVLSRKNRALISDAIAQMGTAITALQALLDATEPTATDDDKAADPPIAALIAADTTDDALSEDAVAQLSNVLALLGQ